jgi:hypothetical protein
MFSAVLQKTVRLDNAAWQKRLETWSDERAGVARDQINNYSRQAVRKA